MIWSFGIAGQKRAGGRESFGKSCLLLAHGAFQRGRLRLRKDGLRRPRFGMALMFAFTEERLENLTQSAAAAEDAGFYRADVALEHFGYFFIAQAFKVAQDYRAAE